MLLAVFVLVRCCLALARLYPVLPCFTNRSMLYNYNDLFLTIHKSNDHAELEGFDPASEAKNS